MTGEQSLQPDRNWIIDELVSLARQPDGAAQLRQFLAFLEGFEREDVLARLFWRALDEEAWEIADLCVSEGFQIEPLAGHSGPIHVWLMVGGQSPKSLEWLIQHGADIEARESSCNYTPLMVACTDNDFFAVKALIDAGADVNATTVIDDNVSVLMCAARNGNADIVRMLLKNGALTGHCTSITGLTASRMAIRYGHVTVAHLIDDVEKRCSVHEPPGLQ